MRKKISIVIPAYNEEQALPLFYRELTRVADALGARYDFEFIFINDGSADGTAEVLAGLRCADSRVNYISMARNFGKEVGMLAGFDHATGDAVVVMDADLQEPPEVLPAMIEKWEQGYCDVYGRRRQRRQSASKRFTSKLYHRILARMADIDLSDDAGDFRLLDRKCVDALRQLRESQRYTKGMYAWIGYDKAPVDYDVNPRVAGTTKWSVGKLVHLALDGITSHSVVPLRLASYLGLTVSLIAFVFLIWVVVKAMIWGDHVAGYPSIMAVMLFLGGSILLAIGIIGEYLGRVFIETKQRPVYFIHDINGNTRVDICGSENNRRNMTSDAVTNAAGDGSGKQ